MISSEGRAVPPSLRLFRPPDFSQIPHEARTPSSWGGNQPPNQDENTPRNHSHRPHRARPSASCGSQSSQLEPQPHLCEWTQLVRMPHLYPAHLHRIRLLESSRLPLRVRSRPAPLQPPQPWRRLPAPGWITLPRFASHQYPLGRSAPRWLPLRHAPWRPSRGPPRRASWRPSRRPLIPDRIWNSQGIKIERRVPDPPFAVLCTATDFHTAIVL